MKGYQNKHKNFELLDRIAQGNVLVDQLASDKLQRHDSTINDTTNMWTLTVNQKPICGNVDKRLYKELYRPNMIAQWSHLFKLTEGMVKGCDWQTYFRSFLGHPPNKQITVVKLNAR